MKLGLPPTIDYSLAARTMAFDLQEKTWSNEILSWANLEKDLLSNIKPSGEIVGKVNKGVAKELGFEKSVIAVTGGHDQPCGALGAGVLSEGVAMNATGTSDTIAVALNKPFLNSLMLRNNYSCYNHVLKNTYIVIAFNLTGGLLLRWYRDTLCEEKIREAKIQRKDVYELIIKKASTEPASVFILPHFVGSGTPTMNSKSKGAILGLTLDTTKAHLSKAVLDSLCYEMRVNLDTLKDMGVDIKEIRVVGGGAKSKIWSQLKANIYGIRVVSLEVSEAACLGAAILAGTAIGYFSSIDRAVKNMVRTKEIFYPCVKEHERYVEKYQIYRKIYPGLAKLNYEIN